MKLFEWDDNKNEILKFSRNISFEEIVFCIANDFVFDIVPYPNQVERPQKNP